LSGGSHLIFLDGKRRRQPTKKYDQNQDDVDDQNLDDSDSDEGNQCFGSVSF